MTRNGVFSNKRSICSNNVNVRIWKRWRKARKRNECNDSRPVCLLSTSHLCTLDWLTFVLEHHGLYLLDNQSLPYILLFSSQVCSIFFREQMSDRFAHTRFQNDSLTLRLFFRKHFLCVRFGFSFLHLLNSNSSGLLFGSFVLMLNSRFICMFLSSG